MATRTDKVNSPVVPQGQPLVKSDLNTAEAQKAKDAQNKRIASQDAARVAQGAGFQRLGKKKGGFDIGDTSHSPIPIPDEQEEEVWSQERLDNAQQNLTMASAQFGDVARAPGESLGATVVGSSFLPTEGDVAAMQKLAEREPPAPMAFDDVTTDVKRLFNIELSDEVPLGHKVLATGLVVAGEAGSVKVNDGGLDEQNLADGLQKVTERGNHAVGEAQKMNKGISRELNLQRTFVFKR